MGRESDKVIRGTAKFLFMFCFLAFTLMIGSFASVAEAAPTVVLKLQVEEPFGSGVWKDTGVIRQTGEKAKYRLDYSISDTEGSTFEGLVAKVNFPAGQGVLSTVGDLVLPDTVSTVFSSFSGGDFAVNVNFKSPMSAGATGTLEFTITGNTNSGPDGKIMTPTITMTGTTVKADSSREPLSVDAGTGPSWTVKAAVSWAVNKTLVTSPPLYVPDEEAYIVEYEIVATRTPTTSSVIGSWGETNYKVIDQLPNIPGLNPEVIFAKSTYYGQDGVYDSGAKTITWTNPSLFSSGTNYTKFRVRVKYPKSEVDLLGGAPVLNLTNTARVESTLAGGLPYRSPDGSITHKVSPSPVPVKGNLTSYKSSSLTEILGSGLDYSPLTYTYYTGFNISGAIDVNYPPKQVEFIDEGLTFIKTDNTTYRPALSEAAFTRVTISSTYIQSIGGTWKFYYRTSNVGPWIPQGAENATSVTFPENASGWRWVVDNPAYAKFGGQNMFTPTVVMSKRDDTMPLLKQVDNKVTTVLTYPDNSLLNTEITKSLPVINDRKIVTRWYANSTQSNWVQPMSGSSLAPGRQATIKLDAYVDQTSSIITKGAFFAALLPPELSFNRISSSPSPYTTTVTPNFQGSGLTLVRLDLNYDFAALTNINPMPSFIADISPTAPLTTYQIPLYFGINSTQANDSSITHSATGISTFLQTDTYDLDGDGDTSEKLAGFNAIFSLGATNAANVAKLSKGPYDEAWKVDASKVEMGDEFQYRIFFRNDSTKTMTHLVLIDILPRPGDIDPLTNSPRNSTWQPILTTAITPPLGGTVYYSTSATPNMSPVVSNGWTGTWTTAAPSDLSTVKAVKIDFGNRQFTPGSSADTYLTMKVPNTSLSNRDAAKNTVDYSVDEVLSDNVSTSPLLPAASGVTSVIFRVPGSILGDFVWADLNGNGLQDSGESGINGLKVELYGYDIGSSSYTKQGETTTTFHPTTNLPGYYSFDGLREGKYYVKFPSGGGYTLTSKNAGSNRAIDSDANANGATDIFDLADDATKLDIDAGYVNLFPVSGTLYYDLDGNGVYSSGTDWPIPSYTVSLKDSTNIVVQTATTDPTGKYAFMVAGAGNYTIEVDATVLQTRGFKETQPTMDNTNAITNRAIVLSNVAVIDQNFGFKSTNTVNAKVIWDTNGNDTLTDPVDQPLAGIKVKLWDLTDSKYVGTTQTTDATGAVSFSGVFLERSYRIDIDSTDAPTNAILAGLVPNVNLFNNLPETPIDKQIITGVLVTSGLEGVFGYKSEDSNPSVPPTLTTYTHIDIATLNTYDATDLIKSGVAVKLIDKVTNIELESALTDSTGKFSFTLGLAEGRAYKVTATTPTGLDAVYNYSGTTKITPTTDTIEVTSYSKPDSLVRFGYRSSTPISVTGKVVWDVNHNNILTDTGVDQNLTGVTVKLMDGTTLLNTKTTDTNGAVTFSDADGLVPGGNYKLVVDKVASGIVLTGLSANINQLNGTSQTPIDDEIILANVQNNDAAIFGYKSDNSSQNPTLTAWTHLDIAPIDDYNASDLAYVGTAVKLVDVATGATMQTGTTDASGKMTFTYGLAAGRSYQVESTTPTGLRLVYTYLNTTAITPLDTKIAVNNYVVSPETIVRYGYRSSTPVDLTAKVVWDTNSNDILTDAGIDQNLAGVKVNLMSGTTVLGTKTTDITGNVTFSDEDGLVTGQAYKLVVDKTASGNVMLGLVANVNLLNGTNQAPVNDEIVITSLVNHDAAIFGYKSQDGNPSDMPKLIAYTYLDIATLNTYDTTDLIKPGVPVRLVDTATGLTLESAVTDATGKCNFTLGLVAGRSYKVIETTPTSLALVYIYANTTLITPTSSTIEIASYVKPESFVRFGYRSSEAVTATAQVIWDVNHNDSLTDSGIDQNLAGVKVNLMNGSILMGTKTTGTDGKVTFSDSDGLVVGENYKLVVDKVASGTVLTSLNVNVNKLNNTNQTPIDDEILITGLVNNDAAVFGYKSKDGNPNPEQTAKLNAYTHIDLPVLNQYDVTDLNRSGITVKLTDTATGLLLQTGVTDSNGRIIFTYGLAENRAYQVEAVTPSNLQIVYNYVNTSQVTPISEMISVANYTQPEMLVRFGYRSSQPVSLQGEVKWEIASGTQLSLANVQVKLMSGTLLIGTKTTGTDGKVIFNETDGLVTGENYKLVVDKSATASIFTNLIAIANQLDGSPQLPIDDEILVNNLINGQGGLFVYGKDSSTAAASLKGYTHLDLSPVGTYQNTDRAYPAVALKLTDVGTGLVLETAVTDSVGVYTFQNGVISGRNYEIEATTPSGLALTYAYVNGTQQAVNTKTSITNLSGDQFVRYGYQSGQPITLTTSVILDVNGNNVLTDPVDQGISPITVSLSYQGAVIATKSTDSTGRVSFTEADGLVTGWNYTLVLDSTSTLLQGLTLSSNFLNGTQLGATSDSIAVSGVANGNDVKFGYQGSGSITGYVTQDLDASGVRSPSDTGLSGLTVTLTGTNGLTATTTTSSSGQYTFSNLPASSYTVTVTRNSSMDGLEFSYDYDDLAGTTPITLDRASVVIGSSQSIYTEVNFGYKNIGGITGIIYEDIRQLGYYTNDDQPIERVQVSLVANSPGILHEGNTYNVGDVIKTIHTGADGNFAFDNLPVGANYKIQIVEYTGGPLKDKMLPSYDPAKPDPITPSPTPYSTEAALNTVSPIGGAYLFGFKAASAPGDIQILKKAGVGSVRMGELVPYTITIINKKGVDIIEDIEIKDLIPAGFKYVDGSGRLKRKGTTTKIQPSGNRPIIFTLTENSGVSRLDQGEEVTLSYFLVVGAGTQPGEYTNLATAHNPRGEQISNQSSATVQVISDPLFDDSLVFGKVFVDRNGDGQQDADEQGLGGVKLVTVRGEIITTDKQGRYHIPAVSGGRSDRGTNFTLKLDVRSLPTGAKVLTDNPRTVRLTPGVPARVNFMISLPEIEEK